MPRIKETTVFSYDELNDKAKERARDWMRDGNSEDNFWSEYVIDDACKVAEILGIELQTRSVKLMGGTTKQEPVIWWALHSQERCNYRAVVDISANDRHMTISCEDVSENGVKQGPFDAIEQALKDFAYWIYKQLEQEYDYQNSDEQIDESIRANEYEFDEKGGIA